MAVRKTAAQIMRKKAAVKVELDKRLPKAQADALWQQAMEKLECVSKCREMQFRADLTAFQGDFPQA